MSKLFGPQICGLVVTVALSLTSMENALAQAVSTSFDLDGDGKNETTAASTRVQAGDLQNDFYDTVSVTNPHAFTGLTFDWELPGAQRFKGGLPVGAKWSDTNHYDSYITPFVFNYSINLTPTGCPAGVGCPAVTKTAEAWSPLNLYNSLKSIRDLFSVGESGTVEGDVDLGTSTDINHYTPQIEVWATMTDEGGDLTLYQYWAADLSNYAANLNWQAYSQDIDDPIASLKAALNPGDTTLLQSVLSTGTPYETAGEVYATVNGQEIDFIAPYLLPVSEPSSLALLGASLIGIWSMRRRRIGAIGSQRAANKPSSAKFPSPPATMGLAG